MVESYQIVFDYLVLIDDTNPEAFSIKLEKIQDDADVHVVQCSRRPTRKVTSDRGGDERCGE